MGELSLSHVSLLLPIMAKKLYRNIIEAKQLCKPKKAKKGLGPKPRYMILCSYSPYRPDTVRLWAKSFVGAVWLSIKFTRAHPYSEVFAYVLSTKGYMGSDSRPL